MRETPGQKKITSRANGISSPKPRQEPSTCAQAPCGSSSRPPSSIASPAALPAPWRHIPCSHPNTRVGGTRSPLSPNRHARPIAIHISRPPRPSRAGPEEDKLPLSGGTLQYSAVLRRCEPRGSGEGTGGTTQESFWAICPHEPRAGGVRSVEANPAEVPRVFSEPLAWVCAELSGGWRR